LQDGGSTYVIESVGIINSIKVKSKADWKVKVQVKVTSANFSLSKTEMPDAFIETIAFLLNPNQSIRDSKNRTT